MFMQIVIIVEEEEVEEDIMVVAITAITVAPVLAFTLAHLSIPGLTTPTLINHITLITHRQLLQSL